ncbi:MAG TPA: hypothetical protein VJK52_06075, partial [Candidatus Nanoarchaeia archaeon]|nr:hypothetical protein [Candidatus Nanoarchaeia archaeon]
STETAAEKFAHLQVMLVADFEQTAQSICGKVIEELRQCNPAPEEELLSAITALSNGEEIAEIATNPDLAAVYNAELDLASLVRDDQLQGREKETDFPLLPEELEMLQTLKIHGIPNTTYAGVLESMQGPRGEITRIANQCNMEFHGGTPFRTSKGPLAIEAEKILRRFPVGKEPMEQEYELARQIIWREKGYGKSVQQDMQRKINAMLHGNKPVRSTLFITQLAQIVGKQWEKERPAEEETIVPSSMSAPAARPLVQASTADLLRERMEKEEFAWNEAVAYIEAHIGEYLKAGALINRRQAEQEFFMYARNHYMDSLKCLTPQMINLAMVIIAEKKLLELYFESDHFLESIRTLEADMLAQESASFVQKKVYLDKNVINFRNLVGELRRIISFAQENSLMPDLGAFISNRLRALTEKMPTIAAQAAKRIPLRPAPLRAPVTREMETNVVPESKPVEKVAPAIRLPDPVENPLPIAPKMPEPEMQKESEEGKSESPLEQKPEVVPVIAEQNVDGIQQPETSGQLLGSLAAHIAWEEHQRALIRQKEEMRTNLFANLSAFIEALSEAMENLPPLERAQRKVKGLIEKNHSKVVFAANRLQTATSMKSVEEEDVDCLNEMLLLLSEHDQLHDQWKKILTIGEEVSEKRMAFQSERREIEEFSEKQLPLLTAGLPVEKLLGITIDLSFPDAYDEKMDQLYLEGTSLEAAMQSDSNEFQTAEVRSSLRQHIDAALENVCALAARLQARASGASAPKQVEASVPEKRISSPLMPDWLQELNDRERKVVDGILAILNMESNGWGFTLKQLRKYLSDIHPGIVLPAETEIATDDELLQLLQKVAFAHENVAPALAELNHGKSPKELKRGSTKCTADLLSKANKPFAMFWNNNLQFAIQMTEHGRKHAEAAGVALDKQQQEQYRRLRAK